MDAVEILRVLARRWVLTLCLFLALGAGLAGVFSTVPQQHRATAMVLVMHQTGKEVSNPYGVVDKAQGQTASLVVRVLSSTPTLADLARLGATAELEISNEGGAVDPDSPYITLVITGTSREEVLRTGQLVMARAREELRNRQEQAGVGPADQLILTDVIPVDATATTRAAQLRAVALAGALGLVLVVMTVVIHDQRGLRRERRGRPRHPARRSAPEVPSTPVDTGAAGTGTPMARNKATYQRIGRPVPPPPGSPPSLVSQRVGAAARREETPGGHPGRVDGPTVVLRAQDGEASDGRARPEPVAAEREAGGEA